MPAVEVNDLVIRHGDLTAVDGLDLRCEPGEVVALLGVNGAGKTSTIEALEGLRPPTSGRVRVLGLDPWAQRDELTSRIGVMPQDLGLPPSTRPTELVTLYRSLRGVTDDSDLLAVVGLTERARSTVRRLSGGERQRLSLALALVGTPEMLFLDEPTAGVDVGGRAVIRRLVAERAEGGCAVLVTTHELDEARRMADRLVIIDRGAVVATGTPDELAGIATADTPRLRFTTAAGLDVVALSDVIGGHVVEETPGDYLADIDPSPRVVAVVTGWLADRDISIDQLSTGRATLDEVFLRLTARPDDAPPGGDPP